MALLQTGNLLVSSNLTVKVADFGTSTLLDLSVLAEGPESSSEDIALDLSINDANSEEERLVCDWCWV